MKNHRHYFVSMRFFLVGLVTLLLAGPPLFSSGTARYRPLESIFHWYIMDYQTGKYRETLKNLEVLLLYFEDDERGIQDNSDERNLKGRIFLLMGATLERLELPAKARGYYRKSLAILDKKIDLDGIDLSRMKIFKKEMELSMKSGSVETAGGTSRKEHNDEEIPDIGVEN